MGTRTLWFCDAVLFALLVPTPAVAATIESYFIEPKPPQAQSREEFKAYLDVAQAEGPQRSIDLATRFVEQFSRSEFLGQVYRLKMHAYRSLGDAEKTIEAGEKSRTANPFDVDTLLTLASVLPSHLVDTDFNETLERAEACANRALQELSGLKASRAVSLSEWRAFLGGMRASAYESLGVVAFKREKYPESVKSFERCIQENPVAEGSQFFRLGVAYQYTGQREKAIAALERAITIGPEIVGAKARVQLQELQASKP
jgi:tetratricopeptide repeat protein